MRRLCRRFVNEVDPRANRRLITSMTVAWCKMAVMMRTIIQERESQRDPGSNSKCRRFAITSHLFS